jgi:predicted kinase
MIILIRGLPGSGKTTLANKLGDELRCPVISSDKIRKRVIKNPEYTSEESEFVYNLMMDMANNIKVVESCIIDATFIDESGDSTSEVIKKLGECIIIECECPEEIILERLKNRKDDYSDADESVYFEMKKRYKSTSNKHMTIDTSDDLDRNVRRITTLLY